MKYYFYVILLIPLFINCKKEKGCVNENAMNYSSEAKKDDGSCIYVSDIAPGVWDIDPNCEEILIPKLDETSMLPLFPLQYDTINFNELFLDTINVMYNSNNSYYIDILGLQIEGEIDNNGIINIPRQSIEFNDFGMPIELDGTGEINETSTGKINLTFYISTGIELFPTYEFSCEISLSKY